jgi:hypothetical protein
MDHIYRCRNSVCDLHIELDKLQKIKTYVFFFSMIFNIHQFICNSPIIFNGRKCHQNVTYSRQYIPEKKFPFGIKQYSFICTIGTTVFFLWSQFLHKDSLRSTTMSQSWTILLCNTAEILLPVCFIDYMSK